MMHLIADDDPGLMILPLHRLVKGVLSESASALVERLRGDFEVQERTNRSAEQLTAALAEVRERGAQGQAVAMLPTGGDPLYLLSRPAGASPLATIPADRDLSWRSLDVVLVDAAIVQPLLAEQSLHAEDAISYTRNAQDALQQVRSGAADLAILVNPTRVEQVAAVALAGERMPEKSTYFYPKAPTGLVLRPLE
jgi:uncharacterized protein (DUF1015 family)